jgi:hypothetical protein
MTFFNKKFVVALSAILLLVSCSASAHGELQKSKYVLSDVKHLSFNEQLRTKHNQLTMIHIIKYLESRVNRTPYVFSGVSIHGWDCSGMVVWTYQHFGVELPHSANAQAHLGYRVHTPRLGDVVVFAYEGSKSFYHSGIYVGNNKVLNANSYYRTTVIESLNDYKNSQVRFVRIVNTTP